MGEYLKPKCIVLLFIILNILIVAYTCRWDIQATRNLGHNVMEWKKDRWTGVTWFVSYQQGSVKEMPVNMDNLIEKFLTNRSVVNFLEPPEEIKEGDVVCYSGKLFWVLDLKQQGEIIIIDEKDKKILVNSNFVRTEKQIEDYLLKKFIKKRELLTKIWLILAGAVFFLLFWGVGRFLLGKKTTLLEGCKKGDGNT